MGNYTHIKDFSVFNGLDLRSAEQVRPRGFAKEALNVMRGPTGSLDTRWGTKCRGRGGSFGVWPYEATNMLSAAKSEIVAVGSSSLTANHELFREIGGTFTIANTGVAVTVSLYWFTATSQFRCKIVRAGVTLIDQALGTGLESSPYSIASLATAISLLSGLTATASASTTVSAAFIDVIDDQVIANGASYVGAYTARENVNRPRWQWKIEGADVSIADDTVNIQAALSASGNGTVYNPLKDGDAVFWAERSDGVSACPLPFVAGTTYFVVSSTNTTIKLAATAGGAAINITTVAVNNVFLCSTVLNPGATFWNYAAELGQDGFRPVSSVQTRGVRYFTAGRVATGIGSSSLPYRESAGLSKYDGQSFYRAGLPQYAYATMVGGAPVAAGNYADAKGTVVARANVNGWDSPRYAFQYRYIDKIGNVIDGQLCDEVEGATAGNGVVELDLGDTQSMSLISRGGFNSNYAIVTGATATTLTPTVSDGCSNSCTMQIGDIAYFWDSRQSRFIQREVTGTGTTLTLAATSLDLDRLSPNYDDGGTPTIIQGAAISANMRIVIWRSQGTGVDNAPKYLVNEIPWSPLYSVYYDDKADSAVGDDLIEPAFVPSLPPPSRYLAVVNTQLVSCGDDANPPTLSFEDIETPEGMPLGTHSFDLPRAAKGVSSSGDTLVTGTDQQIIIATGEFSQFKFRTQAISDNVGLASHESMRQVEEGLLFFESTIGPYVLAGGTQLAPLGAMKYLDGRSASRVEPYFTADYSSATYRPAFSRAIGVVLPKDRLYILFVPLELPAQPGFSMRAASVTTGSIAWVFDYGRGEWFRWAGVDFSACCVKDDTLYFVMRPYTGFGSGTNYTQLGTFYGTQVRNKGKYSYSDHELPLTWVYQPHWETLGKPAQYKRGIRCRISTDGLLVNPTPLTFKTYVNFSTANVSTSTTLSWTAQKDLTVKLIGETCRGLMPEFGSALYYQPFTMSGFELELTSNFREVIKD